ncbi:putative coil containing protein [Vibrio phage 501E54-1]|nr:putative coil containing protein [Vibrio phage 501E54-1]
MCSVTTHLVNEVAESNPEVFMNNGVVSTLRVLYYLGFDVRQDLPRNNVQLHKDILIRSNQFLRKGYKADVYKGYLRHAVDTKQPFDDEGNVRLNKGKLHAMKKYYHEFEILEARDITKYVAEEDMLCLDTTVFSKT